MQVGDRISVNGENCTVKFVGKIPNWNKDNAVGVEWDNLEKGKNNGSLNGVFYFAVFDHNGSFLKESQLNIQAQYGKSFFSAVRQKYVDKSVSDADFKEITFGSKSVQSYGFDLLARINSDMQKLITISVKAVSEVSSSHDPRVLDYFSLVLSPKFDTFSCLKTLDLSQGLFNSIEPVLKILLHCPQVEVLDLNRNNFVKDDEFLFYLLTEPGFSAKLAGLRRRYGKIQSIDLSGNFLRKSTLVIVSLLMTGLHTLSLAGNHISDSWLYSDNVSEFEIFKSDEISPELSMDLPFKDFISISIENSRCITTVQFFSLVKSLSRTINWTSLDLSYNKFNCFPWCILDMTDLSQLNLSSNNISFLTGLEGKPKDNILDTSSQSVPYYASNISSEFVKYNDLSLSWSSNITSLDLSSNNICFFQELDIINCKFPKLQSISLSDNQQLWKDELESFRDKYKSISRSFSFEEFLVNETFFNIVFRFGDNLQTINRTKLTPDERKDSELYFVSKYKEGIFGDINSSESRRLIFSEFGAARYRDLCAKYGISSSLAPKVKTIGNSSSRYPANSLGSQIISLEIKFHGESSVKQITYWFFNTITVLEFKGIVKRLLEAKSIIHLRFFFTLFFDDSSFKTQELVNNEDELFQYRFQWGDTIDVYDN